VSVIKSPKRNPDVKLKIGILTFAMLLLATVVVGCANRPKRTAQSNGAEGAPAPISSALLAVRLCAITNLVAEQLAQVKTPKTFGALYVQVGPEAPFLQGMFERTSPPVEFGTDNMVFRRGAIRDRVTGKTGILLFIKDLTVSESGESATADAWYYASPTGGGGTRYHLKRNESGWRIESREALPEF
jgi:hypothetical protein